jgi:signal transduction histidine kinase/CheY-like chemotaxis protein
MANSKQILEKILYITADNNLAVILQNHVVNFNIAVEVADDFQQIKNTDANIILLDYDSGIYGNNFISTLTPITDYPPIVALLPDNNESLILEVLQLGIANYVVKNKGQINPALLYTIIRNSYANSSLVADNLSQKSELIVAREKALLANKVKGEFLATMSHEIRTPMNVVMGISQLLSYTNLDPKQKKMMETLTTNADLLMKLINNLLDLNHIESKHIEFEKQLFTIAPIIKAMKGMFEPEACTKNLELTFIDLTQNSLIIGDEICVQQIITNLISNAIKFTSQGKVVVIFEIKNEATPSLYVKVQDSGIGIKTENLGLIFDKFSQVDQTITRRFGGSGLGLAICKSLAVQMGGNIICESTPDIGSVFSLILPVEVIAPQQHITKPELAKDEQNKGTILLVEDYPPNIFVASMILDNMGFSVEVAENGMTALNKIISNSKPYIAILMDVQMPDMDGFETTQRIRQIEKEKGFKNNILGVTAHALAGDRDRCLESGMDDYMSKPIHHEVLAKKISTLMGKKIA